MYCGVGLKVRALCVECVEGERREEEEREREGIGYVSVCGRGMCNLISQDQPYFCHGTGVPRHSAVGVGSSYEGSS